MNESFGILIVIPYPSSIGFAIGRLISAFFLAALRVVGSAERVHFCFSDLDDGPCRFLPENFPRVIAADAYRGDTTELQKLGDYARENFIRVVFALDLSVDARCLGYLRGSGVKTVISYWGAPMSSINKGLRLLAKRFQVRYLSHNRPDLFIFESHAMRSHAVRGRGVPAGSTAVINTGVDPEIFRPLPEHRGLIYSRFDIPLERKVVVFMGHLHDRKGVPVLLGAINALVTERRRSDVHVVFLGDRDGESARFSDSAGAAIELGYVTFGGYQSDIPALLSGCYLGCIPSTGWDSFPMSPLEMQACGIPVVVSDLQGTPETIVDGKTGIKVPAGDRYALSDAIELLLDDPQRRKKMSQLARAHVVDNLTVGLQVERLSNAIIKAAATH